MASVKSMDACLSIGNEPPNGRVVSMLSYSEKDPNMVLLSVPGSLRHCSRITTYHNPPTVSLKSDSGDKMQNFIGITQL